MKCIRSVKKYFSTHFAASFVMFLGLLVLSLMFVLQSYLKNEYFQYLIEETYETQNAVLQPMKKSINDSMSEMITRGSEIAIDGDLYDLVQQYGQGREKTAAVNPVQLSIADALELHAYSTNAITIAIAGKDGLVAQYDRYRSTDGSLWNEENNHILQGMAMDMIENSADKEFPRTWTNANPDTHPWYKGNRIFHVGYPLTGGKSSIWKAEYVLVISYSMNIFEGFLDAVEIPGVEYIRGYVSDKNDSIVYHTNRDYIGSSGQEELSNERIQHISAGLEHFGWSINIIIDVERMQEHIDGIYNNGLLVYGSLLIIVITVAFMVFRHLMKPVGLLSKSMRSVETGDYHSKIEIEGEHEIWQVAEEYNHMIDAIRSKNKEIEQQHREKLESIEQKHQAEWEALESQINAHFICNTLGCINYEAIEEGNEKVSVLIKKLSNILRYTFDQKRQNVYIYQEIAWIDQYLYLQKSRLENVFDYEIDFPDIYGHWPCCKLMFQPFVENSILHGFEGRKSGGFIRLHGEMAGERLKIMIEDNGCGMDADTENYIQKIFCEETQLSLDKTMESDKNGKRRGIGVRNVVTRMRMFYGNRFEVFMQTETGKGTRYTFLIPIPGIPDTEDETEEQM